MGMDMKKLMQENEVDPKTDELIETIENNPEKAETIRDEFLEKLKPAILLMKKAPGTDPSREQEFYKSMKKAESADRIKQLIEDWAEDRGLN